ncbi:MAG: hypothetical protein ACTHNE_11695, partial [Dyella sp.]|uniref:hypothetical protein n=1 Tax=Dyella sp. TaxID=1869338 RepID=UPI003F8188E6
QGSGVEGVFLEKGVRRNVGLFPYRAAIPLQVVIPEKAGIHFQERIRATWIPAFAGMTSWRDKKTASWAAFS